MTVVPTKGICSIVIYISIVKGMKHPEAAYALAEQLPSDQGMLGVPQALRYGVTTDVTLTEDLRKDLLFNSPERKALKKKVDWQRWMADRSARIERVTK
ncbi:hypothetical protein [Bradyrhizobium icense]|uniref:Extracellular solute-binding protein n=1 Tax=Bradyrhizobium icense TaxID=1274631 RepID=A0A1B1UJS6_9BRAD|nr:hypothetical protein [Bradyrhizobium icense]ANW03038.1 hypothetical protein LMTR13_25695 [Bradyrhizobium icense]